MTGCKCSDATLPAIVMRRTYAVCLVPRKRNLQQSGPEQIFLAPAAGLKAVSRDPSGARLVGG